MKLKPSMATAGLALLLVCCGKSAGPVATAPATASAIAAPHPRIVSTVPAATLNLILIGAADHLVGVSRYDSLYLPADKKNLPVVGDYQTMNYEQLVTLQPDVLVIQTLASRIEPKLTQAAADGHMQLLNMRFDSVSDIWSSVLELGKAANMESEAKIAIDNAKADLASVALQYKNAPHPKVAYLVSPKIMLLCGGNTFIDEMITAAGGINVGAKAGDGFLDTSRETLIKLAPDVLLIGAMEEMGATENDPRLAQWLSLPVPAAAYHRVYLVTDGNSLMASVNIGKNVRAMAELIQRQGTPPFPAPSASSPAAAPGGVP